MKMNRREFILGGVATSLAGCRCLRFGCHPRTAVQAYSVRDLLSKDFHGTCARLAALGLDGLEMWGTKDFEARMVRRSLDDSRLVACGAHVGIEQLLPDARNWAFDYAQTVGYTRIIVPWLMPEKGLADEPDWWRRQAAVMNAAADAARARGLAIGYHNHDHEFGRSFGGKTVWEILTGEFSDDIFIQWDVGALAHADQDAAAWMRRYPGRCPTIHVKDDWDKDLGYWGVIGEPPPGRPGVDWQAVATELRRHPVEWAVVEPATSDRLDTVARSLARLKELDA